MLSFRLVNRMWRTTTKKSLINPPCTASGAYQQMVRGAERTRNKVGEKNHSALQPRSPFAHSFPWLTQFPSEKLPSLALSNWCLTLEPSSSNTPLQITLGTQGFPGRALNVLYLATPRHLSPTAVSHTFLYPQQEAYDI